MTDMKLPRDPMTDHIKRASIVLGVRLGAAKRPVDVEVLAEQFADVDAIARRRALEEAIGIALKIVNRLDDGGEEPPDGANYVLLELRALLRAPTSEQTSEGAPTPASEALATHPPRGGSGERGTNFTNPICKRCLTPLQLETWSDSDCPPGNGWRCPRCQPIAPTSEQPDIVPIPRPPSVTLTAEQNEQLLANSRAPTSEKAEGACKHGSLRGNDFLLQPDGRWYRCDACGEYVKPDYSACSPPADGGGG